MFEIYLPALGQPNLHVYNISRLTIPRRSFDQIIDIQIRTFDYTHLGFQFSDFQLKSFVDPKPVEL